MSLASGGKLVGQHFHVVLSVYGTTPSRRGLVERPENAPSLLKDRKCRAHGGEAHTAKVLFSSAYYRSKSASAAETAITSAQTTPSRRVLLVTSEPLLGAQESRWPMETTRPRVEPPGAAVPFALNHMRVIDFRATQRPTVIRSWQSRKLRKRYQCPGILSST
ncbi:hypothetical protein COCMIDRAFT_28082 [Bipolaris oryzae ATCC 44560]|uniref:Uncharacterized protein n=1 Tax=Bipolaris oryzae ATCC 44560 TaxID=930090 RepID=W6Z783_COCMI|nr:uncharacterized protein COCMIDRAFT_28082 [Bipolaris oryzae ATCC 44560]EUC43424.1 hypothetical protein COCMIDRAFT_28082 [Bipolaris oryzae ATCC 44560]